MAEATPAEEAVGPRSITEDEHRLAEELKARLAAPNAYVAQLRIYDYVRFLRAREWDIDKAEAMIREVLCIRSFETGMIPRSAVRDELLTGKAFIRGCDRKGRPCVYVRACLHDTATRDPRETELLVLYMLGELERLALDVQTEQFVCVFDFVDFGRGSFDTDILKHILRVLGLHYPERLGHLWFVRTNWLFWALWKVISPFIPTRTRSKISMLGSDWQEKLKEGFEAGKLLEEYGGDDAYSFEDAVADEQRRFDAGEE